MTTTIYQYVFFRLEAEPHKPAYTAYDPDYKDGSAWTPDTSSIYKPFPNLDDSDPLGANPTAFYFEDNIYMLMRANNFLNITGKKVMLQNLYWEVPEVDLNITSENTAVPVVTGKYLHVFHEEPQGTLKWSRFDTKFDQEKKEPTKTEEVASLRGFPSISVAYRDDYKKNIGRVFYKTPDGTLASKGISDLDKMTLSDKETQYPDISLSESPSAVNSHDDKGINTFYVFYRSERDGYLMCTKIDGNGRFLGDYNLSSKDRGAPDIRLDSSPSAVIVGDRANYARVFYVGTDRKINRVIVDLKNMTSVSPVEVPTLSVLPRVSPFAMTAPILVKDFSRSS